MNLFLQESIAEIIPPKTVLKYILDLLSISMVVKQLLIIIQFQIFKLRVKNVVFFIFLNLLFFYCLMPSY